MSPIAHAWSSFQDIFAKFLSVRFIFNKAKPRLIWKDSYFSSFPLWHLIVLKKMATGAFAHNS